MTYSTKSLELLEMLRFFTSNHSRLSHFTRGVVMIRGMMLGIIGFTPLLTQDDGANLGGQPDTNENSGETQGTATEANTNENTGNNDQSGDANKGDASATTATSEGAGTMDESDVVSETPTDTAAAPVSDTGAQSSDAT